MLAAGTFALAVIVLQVLGSPLLAQVSGENERVALFSLNQSISWAAALAVAKRDLKVKHAIEHQVRLVRIQENRLEIALAPGVPAGITSELSTKLTEWTGNRWFVAISDSEGAPTIAEDDRG